MDGTVWVLVLVFSAAALTIGLTVRDILRDRHASPTPGSCESPDLAPAGQPVRPDARGSTE